MTILKRPGIGLLSLAALASITFTVPAAAVADDSYPSRPIHLVLGSPPGGGADNMAQIIALNLSESLGQRVVVEHKPGAGGEIAKDYVAQQPADGYTLLWGGTTQPINEATAIVGEEAVTHEIDKAFAPIVQTAVAPYILVVDPQTPYQTVGDFVEAARAQPGMIPVGTSGAGNTNDIAAALFAQMAGIELLHVPFQGSSRILTAIMGHEVQASFSPAAAATQFINEGQVRPLAVLGRERLASMPDLPTAAEAANLPDYYMESWFGMWAPAGTPDAVVAKLNEAVNELLAQDAVKESIDKLGLIPGGGTSADFGAKVVSVRDQHVELFKKIGLKTE